MFAAIENKVEDCKIVCTGQSKGQVKRILCQMGLDWNQYRIIDLDAPDIYR